MRNTILSRTLIRRQKIESTWFQWIALGLFLCGLVGFVTTWLFSTPIETKHITVVNATVPSLSTRGQNRDLATVATKQKKSKQGLDIDSQTIQTKVEWSAETFLDVLQPPKTHTDAATKIQQVIQSSTLTNQKDPYISQLINEVNVFRGQRRITQHGQIEASDQATFSDAIIAEQLHSVQPPATNEKTVIVQEGDSLSKIASIVYGNPSYYKRIFYANRDIMDNPDRLQSGLRLRIPEK